MLSSRHSCSTLTPRHGSGHQELHTQSNLETSTPCTTSLVVSGLKQYRNDQCGSVRTGLSVRTLGTRASPRFRTPRKYIHTQSNLRTSLRSYVTGRFRIKTVLKQPVRFGSYRAFGPSARTSHETRTRHHYQHNLISKPHSVPTSLVVQD